MKLQWNEQYELGIGVIDNQHKRIVDYINDVHALQTSDANPDHLQQVLDYLVDYTQSHFAFEEALLEEAGYAQLSDHQRSHRLFIEQLDQLRQDFQDGQDVKVELGALLMRWLLEHIQSDDRSYSQLVKNKLLLQSPHEHASWVARTSQKFFAGRH